MCLLRLGQQDVTVQHGEPVQRDQRGRLDAAHHPAQQLVLGGGELPHGVAMAGGARRPAGPAQRAPLQLLQARLRGRAAPLAAALQEN